MSRHRARPDPGSGARPRWCSLCAKVSHPDRGSARTAARHMRRDPDARGGRILTAYRCPHTPDRYHLGHDARREAAAHHDETAARTRLAAAERRHRIADIARHLGPPDPTRGTPDTPPSTP